MKNQGFLLIDKPAGITSFKVISILRKITNIKKIGHTGTLDPFATGLLPVCIGKVTRLQKYLSGSYKSYIAEIKLGIKTDTGDVTGKIIQEAVVPEISQEQIDNAAYSILQTDSQIPPQYSAVKKDGKRAYELARKGIKVDLSPRQIHIDSFKILSYENSVIRYKAKVSKGTYIRVLSETFAEYLGTIATTTALIRTEINDLKIDNAVKLDDLTPQNWNDHLLSPIDVLKLEKILLDQKDSALFCHGGRIRTDRESDKDVMVLAGNGELIGIAVIKDGVLQPQIVF